jgi:hypothetical protein
MCGDSTTCPSGSVIVSVIVILQAGRRLGPPRPAAVGMAIT